MAGKTRHINAMKRQYNPAFIKTLKKIDVRIRNSFKEKIVIFAKNPYDPNLNNHKLKQDYFGYRSIDITNNYRAHYKQIKEEGEMVAYFVTIGTHEELYGKSDS